MRPGLICHFQGSSRKLTANLEHGWLDVVELRRLRHVGGFPVEGKSSSFVGHLNGSTS